jgi:25S rRNA (cytosine2278-C5)-methyltransferase
MSLYFDAANVLLNNEGAGGSLKSRTFNNKKLKNSPARVYALIAQTTKWSPILKEVIEKSGLLQTEKKVSHRPHRSPVF